MVPFWSKEDDQWDFIKPLSQTLFRHIPADPMSNPVIYYIKWVVSESIGGFKQVRQKLMTQRYLGFSSNYEDLNFHLILIHDNLKKKLGGNFSSLFKQSLVKRFVGSEPFANASENSWPAWFCAGWAGVKRSWAASHPSYQHRRHITMHQTLQFKYRGSDAVLQSHAIICSTSHKIQSLGADSDLICRHPGSARRTEAAASTIVSHFQFRIFTNPVINDFALLYQWICFWHSPK